MVPAASASEAAFRTCKTDLGCGQSSAKSRTRRSPYFGERSLARWPGAAPVARKIENEVPRIDPDKTQDPVDQDRLPATDEFG